MYRRKWSIDGANHVGHGDVRCGQSEQIPAAIASARSDDSGRSQGPENCLAKLEGGVLGVCEVFASNGMACWGNC